MRNKHPRMKLSREEETFLRHWMYDEVHYQEGVGPAKRLQREHHVPPADLALLISAAMPNPADQEAAGVGPTPQQAPVWPWSGDAFQTRLSEARALLAQRRKTIPGGASISQ